MQSIDKILASIIGLAIVAVIVGRYAQTSSVVQSISTGLSQVLGVVVSPVSAAAANSAAGAPSNASGGSDPIASLLHSAAAASGAFNFGTGGGASDIVSSLGSLIGA